MLNHCIVSKIMQHTTDIAHELENEKVCNKIFKLLKYTKNLPPRKVFFSI